MAQTIAARYQGRAYGFFVTIYIIFLVVPWILTCFQARRPFLLTKTLTGANYDVELHGIRQVDADTSTRFSYALEALTCIAALLAIPITYEILARAAVIHTLRTRRTKQLNAEQLFALADRKFIWGYFRPQARTEFSFIAVSLVLLTIAHVIARGVGVGVEWNQHMLATQTGRAPDVRLYSPRVPYGWFAVPIGISPTPQAIVGLPVWNVLTRLRQDLIGSHPGEWREKAWFSPDEGKYFASTLTKGTTTGLAKNLALRMDSEFSCWKPQWGTVEEYPEDCLDGEPYFYRHPELNLTICVNGNGTGYGKYGLGSLWRDTTKKQHITENLMVRLIDEEYTDKYNRTLLRSKQWGWKGDIRCTVETELAYFELGNDYNNKTFGPKLDRLAEPHAELLDIAQRLNWFAGRDVDYYNDLYRDRYSYTEINTEMQRPVPGPLTLASRALFGSGSFFDISQRISLDNPVRAIDSASLANSCPYPFQRHPLLEYDCDEERSRDKDVRWGAKGVVEFLNLLDPANRERYMPGVDATVRPGKELLDSALALANQAVMDLSLRQTDTDNFSGIFRAEGVAVRQFVMSDPVMGTISVLLGLQILVILGLLRYTYRVPTWTWTLDSLAIARIAQQLKDGRLLRSVGLRTVTKQERKKLAEIDALVGLHEPIPLEDMSSTAAATPTARDTPGRGSGLSATTQGDSQSRHSQTLAVPVVSNDPQMGMSSVPIDVQTVVSEDLDNSNNNSADNQGSDSRLRSFDRPLPAPPIESSTGRLSFNIADMVPEHDTENHPDGPSSPPAYTPRTAGPEPPLNLMPPSYASALAVPELRVGGQGVVTRKNIPRTRDDLWV
ncbi:hypothetical protein V8F20_005184 [Naviculisporaceae sp. PSN 640]